MPSVMIVPMCFLECFGERVLVESVDGDDCGDVTVFKRMEMLLLLIMVMLVESGKILIFFFFSGSSHCHLLMSLTHHQVVWLDVFDNFTLHVGKNLNENGLSGQRYALSRDSTKCDFSNGVFACIHTTFHSVCVVFASGLMNNVARILAL